MKNSLVEKYYKGDKLNNCSNCSSCNGCNTKKEVEKVEKFDFKKQISTFTNAYYKVMDIVAKGEKISNLNELNNLELKNYKIVFDGSNCHYIKVMDIETNFIYANFSLGNKKLQNSDSIQFLIFNLLQWLTCPHATELCRKFCYANKAFNKCRYMDLNNKRGTSVISRTRNVVFSMYANFEQIFNEVIQFAYSLKGENQKLTVRFHESGDIYCDHYQNKVINIMTNEKNKDVDFVAYTRTKTMLNHINNLNSRKNIGVRYSIDMTTPSHILEKCEELNCLRYIVTDKQDNEKLAMIEPQWVCNINQTTKYETLNKLEYARLNKDKKSENEALKELIDTDVKCDKCRKCWKNKTQTIIFTGIH